MKINFSFINRRLEKLENKKAPLGAFLIISQWFLFFLFGEIPDDSDHHDCHDYPKPSVHDKNFKIRLNYSTLKSFLFFSFFKLTSG